MLHCTKSTPGAKPGIWPLLVVKYMKILLNKYHKRSFACLCCIATCFLAVSWSAQAFADSPRARIKPLLVLDDAVRLLERRGDPTQLIELEQGSGSRYVRHEAAAKLADHYAFTRNWGQYARFEDRAGACARMLEALHRQGPAAISELIDAVLQEDPRDKTCSHALETASVAGFLRDEKIWRQIRVLVDSRKSQTARRKLLPLLKDQPVSGSQLNNAIQNATRRIKGKHPLETRAEQELLAVSAIVAARRNPVLAGERWEKFAPFIDDDIDVQVWPIIGKHASQDHEAREALSFFQRAPFHEHGRYELAWRARAAMRLRDWNDVKWTTDAMVGEQATLPDWRFWNAYSQLKVAPTAQATLAMQQLARESDSFYGLLAKSLTGIPLTKGWATHDPLVEQRLAEDVDVDMAIALGISGNTVRARKVWKFLNKDMSDGELLAASILAAKEGWNLGAINAADRAAPDASNHDLRYPVPYLETVSKYTKQFDIDPAFVYAIMRQESRFNPRAMSSAGARGLMQVMPATAKAVARRHSYTRYQTSRLFLLDTNVIIGTRYIADLRRSLGQDPILIAATYNAGPSNVKKWRRNSKGVDKLVFIETIPFTETRLYVKHVMANMAHYDLRFNSATKPWHQWIKGRY